MSNELVVKQPSQFEKLQKQINELMQQQMLEVLKETQEVRAIALDTQIQVEEYKEQLEIQR